MLTHVVAGNCRFMTSQLSFKHTLVTPQTLLAMPLHVSGPASANNMASVMKAGFSGDVGCAVSTVIAILGALGKECSEVRPCFGAIL